MSAAPLRTREDLDRLDFEKGGGVIPVVTQDARTRRVLMLAFADRDALERTLSSGEMHYLSRTRGPWHKGATSGNVQRVQSLSCDCDGDSVLALVTPSGPACHTGAESCFLAPAHDAFSLATLDAIIAERQASADGGKQSYTKRLLDDRNLRLKKLGEECAELVAACADGDRTAAVTEAADLLYHMMVALRAVGAGLDDVERVLGERR